ncbi:retinoblastoma-like protein 2 [Protopterus annectens]|uniref:retinoblastoma-like protein 2 n=1 Tax=Protopterus annectens TaxID=7888 RepID=UPI001CFA01BD|nr:retinoblastoma-like protein 2 [Protopterus annectens]
MTTEEEENTEKTKELFDELCRNLNVDEVAANDAWISYDSINKNYTLEGNNLHWLACALYVACRRTVPTVSRGTVEGNYVSLTKILQYSHQSWIEFFKKMKKWEDMADLQPEFRERTSKLERNFTVSAVIYKKYEPMFRYIFKDPQEDQPRQQRGRKQRRGPCPASQQFHFCWVVFYFYFLGNFPMISDDLVNSYHLLLCALDLVYGNALLCSNRKELLNPNFKGLPEDFNSRDYRAPASLPCVIAHLCSVYDGVVLEAKGIKEHYWNPYIKKIFHKKILKGREDSLIGFIDPGNFGESLKALSRAYEEYILSVGTLDERIFLTKDTEDEIPGRCLSSTPGKESTDSLQNKAFSVSTPLTGRHYIKESNLCATPITTAMYGVSRLHTMLAGVRYSPSEKLLQIFRSCSKDPSKSIVNRLKEMYDTFCAHFTDAETEYSSCSKDIATKYFRLAEILYYKVMECALETEKKRLGDIDLTKILEQDVFHRSLMACCLEIVLFSYKPPGSFPWIINVFDLQPYNFYKVIEVTIRAEDNLFREVVKHLNNIEEQIIESLAWKKSSPLWTGIRDADNKVPSCQEVMPPQYFENSTGNISLNSPVTPSRTSEVRTETGLGSTASPSPAALLDIYSSPNPGSARRRLFPENDSCSEPAGQARVPQPQVINTVPTQSMAPETVSVTPVPGQTLVTMATATVTANNGQTVTIPVHGIATENGAITFIPVQLSVSGQSQTVAPLSAQTLAGSLTTQQITGTTLQMAGPVTVQKVTPSPGQQQRQTLQGAASQKQKKMGSLCLFIRKVFHLASVRLRDLSDKLEISDELRKIIWTCFEFSLVQCPKLMMDRHLDQLLMCAVYVMAKVTQRDKSFHDIMKCYRTQPQASSHVYRSVLLKGRRKRRCSGSSDGSGRQSSPRETSTGRSSRDSSPVMRSDSTLPVPQPNSAPPTPTCLTGPNSDVEEEERGDLIQFYNDIYTEQIEDFAKKYSPNRRSEAPPLSPYPCHRITSPRRVQLSQHHSIYISPHENSDVPTPQDRMLYCFSSSPSKMLKDINNMIKSGETPTKKRGILLEDGSESPAKRICQENQSALMRRLQDVANDRGSH